MKRLLSIFQKINKPLIIGIALVGVMLFMALIGPSIAPQDPMKENFALTVNGKIRTPPYPAFTLPGYPLGTDRFGRDLWSRILWGVRPTLIMVFAVAGFRLGVGILLGLVIGWSRGRAGRFLESVLTTALSIPVLIVALIGIYAIGIEHGLWAFIFGLGLTGWAESGRIVQEQTRLIKEQTFIEASRALGAGDRHVMFVHILRQIMPMIWMLIAFEISSTLLVSAELGFLGYYIGGGIWVEVSDFNAVNTSGLPELGQMLSTSLVKITDPTAMLVVGTFIFTGVLGFNMLGEGLRREFSQERMRRGFGILSSEVEERLEMNIFRPIRYWLEIHQKLVWGSTVIIIVIAGVWFFYDRYSYQFSAQEQTTTIPGGHFWATERHDPFGTFWAPVTLPATPTMLWALPVPGGPSGGPAVMADGTIIIAGREKILMAVSPEGKIIWETPLDEVPYKSPALDADGQIFVVDEKGGVSAFSPSGEKIWRAAISTNRQPTSGPIVDSNGTIYLTMTDVLAAVSPQGKVLWRVTASDIYIEIPPMLSLDQKMIFLKNSALTTSDGSRVDLELADEFQTIFADPAFFTGADGGSYYRLGHDVIPWHLAGADLVKDSPRTWGYQSSVTFLPLDQGVTPDGLTWLFYSTSYSDSHIVWLDGQSRVVGNFRYPKSYARLIGLGSKDEAYICVGLTVKVECISIQPGASDAAWTLGIEGQSGVVGGALVPGRLYLAFSDTDLTAFGSGE